MSEGVGTLEHTIPVPVWTLVIGVLAWVGTNLMIWVATGKRAKTIVKGAKEESVRQKDEVVDHFDEALAKLDSAAVEAKFTALDEALGAKFAEWDAALVEMPKTVSTHVAMALGSQKGVEMKALYAEAVQGEEELETYVAEGMDAGDMALAKMQALEPSDDWKQKHPLGAMLVAGGMELFRAKIDEQRGVVSMKKLGSGKKPPKGFR